MKSNFKFLNRYWPALAQIGETAENYLYSDPNACIFKIGLFCRALGAGNPCVRENVRTRSG